MRGSPLNQAERLNSVNAIKPAAAKTEAVKRTTAIASAVIGGIVLLGLLISAIQWLFGFEEDIGSLVGLL